MISSATRWRGMLSHLAKRYELQTQADIAILRATLLRPGEGAAWRCQLILDEREELAGVMGVRQRFMR